MSLYCGGAIYGSNSMVKAFCENSVFCLGWDEEEAPTLYEVLKEVSLGDYFAIKSFSPNDGLRIKAVGIVTDPAIRKMPNGLGWGIDVEWVWHYWGPDDLIIEGNSVQHIGRMDDKWDNVRVATLYKEYNVELIDFVFRTILEKKPPVDFWED